MLLLLHCALLTGLVCTPPGSQGGAPAPAAGTTLDAELARLDRLLVEDLWAYAQWCGERHLYAERLRVLERLLALEPGHEGARELAGHKRNKKGEWIPPERRRSLEDAAVDRTELAVRRSAAVARWRDGRLSALAAAGGEIAPGRREELLRAVLEIAPDDPEVREQLGEERFGRAWLAHESARAYDQRPSIRALVAEAWRQAGDPRALVREEPSERFGFEFPVCVRGPHVRVLSTGTLEEAWTVLQASEACGIVARRLLGRDTPFPAGLTLHLLADQAEKAPFLAALPDLTPEERSFLARLDAAGIPRTADGVFWYPDLDRRLDAAVRHVLAGFLRDGFGLWTRHAWAWEGVGLYLTRELVGTRLTWYVELKPEEQRSRARGRTSARGFGPAAGELPSRAELLATHASWIDPAWRLLASERSPSLAKVMAAEANALGIEELLVAYALCVYLIEGRPDELPQVLERTGRGETPEEIARHALGHELEELHARLLRFLSERREPSYWGA